MTTRRSLLVALLLTACPAPAPPPVPTDVPRRDGGVDAAVSDVPAEMDAPPDVPVLDVPADVRAPDAPDASCEMRADCDMNGSCETVLGTATNCQDCGDRCMAPAGATASCDFATGCSWECNTGFANCDMADGNGCEVNTNTSLMHCGGCGMACGTTLLNAQAACSVGDCLVTCRSGFGDCDMDLMMTGSNGCEIDTRSSLMHCGSCGMPCTLPSGAMNAAPACMSGMCRFTCMTGFRNCDSNDSNGCEHMGATCP